MATIILLLKKSKEPVPELASLTPIERGNSRPILGPERLRAKRPFSEAQAGTTRAAPELGEHTDEVLSGLCGYSAAEIAQLKSAGAVGTGVP